MSTIHEQIDELIAADLQKELQGGEPAASGDDGIGGVLFPADDEGLQEAVCGDACRQFGESGVCSGCLADVAIPGGKFVQRYQCG